MKMIRVLHTPVGEPPSVKEIDRDDLRSVVSLIDNGYLEVAWEFGDYLMLVDEDGFRKFLTPNFKLNNTTMILGPAFFCRRSAEEFEGLNADDIKTLTALVLGWRDNLLKVR